MKMTLNGLVDKVEVKLAQGVDLSYWEEQIVETTIAIVIKEAAKVAKDHKKARHLHYGVGNQSALLAADTIAAGILALGDKP